MLKTRIITALVLVIGVSFMLVFANDFWWQQLLLLIVFVIGFEWAGFAKKDSSLIKVVWGGAFLTAIFLLDIFLANNIFLDFLFFIPLIIMVFLVVLFQLRKAKSIITNSFGLFLLGILVIYPFYYAMLAIKENFSIAIILISFFAIWAVDIGAYFVGRKFGKTKLALYVSPGKSWEGVFGGVVLSFLVSYLGLYIIQLEINVSYLLLAVILSTIGALSIFGDLFESILKRQVAMKDSSQILPGHGGVLDRLDSLILAMPLFLLIWQWISI